jgi:hypothetical protein
VNVGGSLTTTSGRLVTTQDLLLRIEEVLDKAQASSSNGTEAIPVNVSLANGELRPVEEDTTRIDGELNDVNQHLTSICEATDIEGLPELLALVAGGATDAEILAFIGSGGLRPGNREC